MILNPGEINLDAALKICQETLKKRQRRRIYAFDCYSY